MGYSSLGNLFQSCVPTRDSTLKSTQNILSSDFSQCVEVGKEEWGMVS